MALVQLLGIQRLRARLRLQDGLVQLALLQQLLHGNEKGVADHFEAQPLEVQQLLRHGTGRRVRRIQRAFAEIARMGAGLRLLGGRQLGDQHQRFGAIRQPTLQLPHQLWLPGPEQQHAHAVEQRMEQRQLDQRVVAQAEGRHQPLHQPAQWQQQDQRHQRRQHVEQHMRQRQPLTAAVATQRADEGSGNARADIRADGDGQALAQFELPTGQRCQRQHQGGVAGLQHDGGEHADGDEGQLAKYAFRLPGGHVQAVIEAGKARLDLIDTEKDEGDAQHHAPGGLALVAREAGQHAEHQQRQRQRTQAEILSGHGQQPDTAGGAEVGAEENRHTTGQLDQPGTDEGDGQQRNQRARLQQHGAAHAEQQALERRRGAARQELFQMATGQVAQPLLQALHAEQEQRQAGA